MHRSFAPVNESFVRYFVSPIPALKMKKFLAVLVVILLVVAAIWWWKSPSNDIAPAPKQQAIHLSDHSNLFNQKVDSLLQAYFVVNAAFVKADTTAVKTAVTSLLDHVNRLPLEELKSDSSVVAATVQQFLGDVRSSANSILLQTELREMRQEYRMVNESMYPLIKSIGYRGPRLYWFTCADAFGEGNTANWLNNNRDIQNPYLTKTPACGEVVDSTQ